MPKVLTEDEFGELLRTFEVDAFRLELQRQYAEPEEEATVARFLAGDPEPPTAVASLKAWFDQVAVLSAAGKRIERVRVHEDPPTPYQRWERWIGKWNIEAGETIRYMTRAEALQIGLLPAAGDRDWWLLDSSRLIRMSFDNQGHRVLTELVEDPDAVAQAGAWRDLAIRHSRPDSPGAHSTEGAC
ncbi:MAG: hypothetical protein IRY92_04760 [Dactylosporangium sp.]|jgi:hypothetical protein|nr:hypothetical protein [Dactylosporangium sp.]